MSKLEVPAENAEMTEEEYASAMHELLSEVAEEDLGKTISGVLEFLMMRAIMDGGYYIMADDENAITVFAANEDAKELRSLLPKRFKDWKDALDDVEPIMAEPFLTNRDPGDEQLELFPNEAVINEAESGLEDVGE